jgi:hypothetical protein
MKPTRIVLMFLVILTVAAVAEAQCLVCQRVDPSAPPRVGECVDSGGGVCSGTCCGGWLGDACTTPAAFSPCGWWLAKKADANRPLLERAIQRNEPAFTSRLLLERNATSTHRRMSRCAA